MGGAYDLFGNGKTAIKVSMSKYLQAPYNGDVYTINNPAVTLVQTISRGWTRLPWRSTTNFVADCDFMNPLANGECQAWTNLNWGQQGQTTQVNPDVQEGWGMRNWDWQFSAGVQHEILPRVSVDVSYSRRWWGNFFVTHNRALGRADYDEVTLTAPLDSRLPDGGGYPVSFLVRNSRSVARRLRSVLHDDQATSATRRTTGTASTSRSTRACQRSAVPRRHQHRPRRQRHLRGADRPLRPADDAQTARGATA